MLKKLNVLTTVHLESGRLICVSISRIMSLFVFLLWLTISLACFQRYLTLWTRIVIVSSEIILLFNVEINQFLSVVHTQVMHLYLLLFQIFGIPYTIKIVISLYTTEWSKYWTYNHWQDIMGFFKSVFKTPPLRLCNVANW